MADMASSFGRIPLERLIMALLELDGVYDVSSTRGGRRSSIGLDALRAALGDSDMRVEGPASAEERMLEKDMGSLTRGGA